MNYHCPVCERYEEPDSWKLKSWRETTPNYQRHFFHVPLCRYGHEMESLEAAEEFKRDQVAEMRPLVQFKEQA